MAESESPERETDSPESCPELDDEFFNNIGQTFEVLDSWTAGDDGNEAKAPEDEPDDPKEENSSEHSRSSIKDYDRDKSRSPERERISTYRPSRFSPPGGQRPRPKRLRSPPSNLSKSASFGLVEAPGPSIVLVRRRMMPVGPYRSSLPSFMPPSEFMSTPNFQPYHNLKPSSAFKDRPNFMQQQQYPSNQFPPMDFVQPVRSTRMMHPNAARVENLRDPRLMQKYPPFEIPAPPFEIPAPPVLFKPPEPDEPKNFLEVRRKAFENGNSDFLNDLRLISDQTSRKEAEDVAKMKAKREDERLRAEQADKAEKYEKLLRDLNSKWAPIQEPSTSEIRLEPALSTLMVIIPIDYPKSIISSESCKRIEEKLSIAMELHSRFHPGFIIKIKNIEPKQGVIGVTCDDIATANWLKSAVRDLNRRLECKHLEQAQLPPCFMVWVSDPKADFEQVRLVIGQQGICTRYWILMQAYKPDMNTATPGRKFLFLGDNALKERFPEGNTLKVQYKFYRTKATIRLLKGIGESPRPPLKDVLEERRAINGELDIQRAVFAKGQRQAHNKALVQNNPLNGEQTEAPLLGQKRTLPEASKFKNSRCNICRGCHNTANCKAINLSNYCKAIPDSITTLASDEAQSDSTKSTVTSQHPVAAKSAAYLTDWEPADSSQPSPPGTSVAESTVQLNNSFNRDGSLDLAILPATYPEVCISQEVLGQVQRFLTRARLERMDNHVSLSPLTIKSGLLVSHCPNRTSAEWMAEMIMSRDWTLQAGAPIQIRPLNDVDVAPTFELWIPSTHKFQDVQRLIRVSSRNTIDTSTWRMTKEPKTNFLADQLHNGKPRGKRFIFLAGNNLLRIAGDSNSFKVSYGAFNGRIRVITRGGINSGIMQDRARAVEEKRYEEKREAKIRAQLINEAFDKEWGDYFIADQPDSAAQVGAWTNDQQSQNLPM